MQPSPRSPRPPSQHKQPPFYWRGNADDFQQQEYLLEQLRAAQQENCEARAEFERLQCALNKLQPILRRQDHRALAASARDHDALRKETDLRHSLATTEAELRRSQGRLKELKSRAGPQHISCLQKEFARFSLDIRNLEVLRDEADLECQSLRRNHTRLLISEEYANAHVMAFRIEKSRRKQSYLKQQVEEARLAIEFGHPPKTINRTAQNVALLAKLERKAKPAIALRRLKERKERRPPKREKEIRLLLGLIDELNATMKDLGMTADIVNVARLEAKCLTQPEPDESEYEEEQPEQAPPPKRNQPVDLTTRSRRRAAQDSQKTFVTNVVPQQNEQATEAEGLLSGRTPEQTTWGFDKGALVESDPTRAEGMEPEPETEQKPEPEPEGNAEQEPEGDAEQEPEAEVHQEAEANAEHIGLA
jgi:hypothetical protein